MAEGTPIVQSDVLADSGATHQSILDHLFSVLDGAWKALESRLPAHPNKAVVLDQIKAAYDNGAAIVKDDFEKVSAQAKEAVAAAEPVLEQDAATVVGQAEQEASTVAEDAAADVTPEGAVSTPTVGPGTSPASSSAAPEAPAAS